MIHKIITRFLAIAILFTCVSCSDDDKVIPEVDYYEQAFFEIYVTDSIGNNLLDPNRPDNLIDKGLTIMYEDSIYTIEGTEYYLKRKAKVTQTRAVYRGFRPPFLYDIPENAPVCIVIVFGEEIANKPWSESATLNWPDGTKTELSFYVNETGPNKAHYFIDGKETESNICKFVK